MRLWVSLGCTPEEIANPQPVDVEIKIQLRNEPIGCQSDCLSDVICYKMTVDKVIEATKSRTFHLIEHLAATIFTAVVEAIAPQEGSLEITVEKPNHPIPHVNKPMVFRLHRRLPQKSS